MVLGEIHDNPQHHRNQARAVASIHPKALVFEMLTPSQASRATQAARQTEASLAAALGWANSGWPDFALYWPIFHAVPEARIFGGALPESEVRRAVSEGAAAVFGPAAERYGLRSPLPPSELSERRSDQQEAHCGALPDRLLTGMVEAQRLRDAALARAAAEAFRATGGPVAIITGTGHARRDWGIPSVLRRAEPGLSVLSIGQVEGEAQPDMPFDLWLVTPEIERPDPCLAFRKG